MYVHGAHKAILTLNLITSNAGAAELTKESDFTNAQRNLIFFNQAVINGCAQTKTTNRTEHIAIATCNRPFLIIPNVYLMKLSNLSLLS